MSGLGNPAAVKTSMACPSGVMALFAISRVIVKLSAMKRLVLAVLVLCIFGITQAAEPAQLTLARIFTDKGFEEEKMDLFKWSKRGARYFVLEAQGEDKRADYQRAWKTRLQKPEPTDAERLAWWMKSYGLE